MKKTIYRLLALGAAGLALAGPARLAAQTPAAAPASLVAYAGSAGQDKFLDVLRLSDGTYLVAGTAQDLGWVPPGVPRTVLAGSGGLHNVASPTPRIGFIAQFSGDCTTLLRVVSLPAGAAESISRLRLSSVPGQPSGALFISGTTADTRAAEGGYFLARLDGNFVSAAPTALAWATNVWAEGYVYDRQPWDVGPDRLVYTTGQSHGNDWCAAYALNPATGQRVVVPEWRTHWLRAGGEFKGRAADAPGGAAAVDFSGIVFKKTGRCDLRSWTRADYERQLPDGNGRNRQGRWPLEHHLVGLHRISVIALKLGDEVWCDVRSPIHDRADGPFDDSYDVIPGHRPVGLERVGDSQHLSTVGRQDNHRAVVQLGEFFLDRIRHWLLARLPRCALA